MVKEIDSLAKAKCFLTRLQTLSFLISVLAVCCAQANYNATVLSLNMTKTVKKMKINDFVNMTLVIMLTQVTLHPSPTH